MNAMHIAVRDYMSANPVTVSPQTEITQVARILIEQDISGVVVVDDADVVVGVLTERDCIGAATSANYYGEWGGPAGQFMSSPVEYVSPDDNLVDVAERMAKSVFRRYPVMEEGRLVGLLARRDVMRALTTSTR
jgi:CBS domain-containing protein